MLQRLFIAEGYLVTTAERGAQGMKQLGAHPFDAVLCDVRLPDANGVELTQAIKSHRPDVEVVVLTAFGTIQDAVQAVRNGAFQYLVKGDDNNKLIPVVGQAVERARQQRADRPDKRKTFEMITGRSSAIQNAIALARKVAPTDATVLLTGATGTGKEVFAHAIHAASMRADGPMVAINCGAFSRELLESELFGHVAGAFTGAVKDKKGLLEEAKGGTLLLDEIGEMPMDLQTKLLRVLETGDYFKLGTSKPIKADVRVIAATNRDLKADAEAGRFRLDLYFRLATFTIELPSLNARRQDIPLLAQEFIARFGAKKGSAITGLDEAVKERLMQHDWKGHVRELRNVIERACILCDGPVLDVASLPLEMQSAPTSGKAASFDLEGVEREHIRRVLIHTGGNKTLAAELLGIGLTTLYAKVKRFGL